MTHLTTPAYPATHTPHVVDPALVYLASITLRSAATARWSLGVCAEILFGFDGGFLAAPWELLGRAQFQGLRATLRERYAAHTCNSMLGHLRSVLKEAWLLGAVSAEVYQAAAATASVPGSVEPAGRALETWEISRLLEAATNDNRDIGRRDAALISLLYSTGMRRFELASLDVSDYSSHAGELIVRHGKGNRARKCYPAPWACGSLNEWLDVKIPPLPTLLPALFPRARKGSTFSGRLTGAGVAIVCRRRALEAGIEQFSPHDLRRTAITHLLEAGVDLATVQRFAGHSQVSTTVRYDRRGEKAVRIASALLNVKGS